MHSNKKDMIILLGEILDILKLPSNSDEKQHEEELSLSSSPTNVRSYKHTNDNEDQQRSVTNVARYLYWM